MITRRRSIHLAILTLLCAWMYAARPGAVGLLSTQEAFRATAARNMQHSGDFLVPTLDGRTPYLTKSPMMYWVAVGIAELRGGEVSEVDVRLTSALGGLAGVLALYFGAIVILRPRDDQPAPAVIEDAAWWSALGLATGVLYVRSSRTAELDILMVAPVIIAIAAIARAWRAAADEHGQPLSPSTLLRPAPHARTRWTCIAIASIAAAFASLVKPVVPVLIIALATYGAMVVDAALTRCPTPRAWRLAARLAGVITAMTLATLSILNARDNPWLGAAMFAILGAALGWGLVRAAHPPRLRRWLTAWSRTHPIVVIPLALASYAIWIAMVRAQVGGDVIRELAQTETANNLNLLLPRAIVRNLGFAAYGLLPIGIAAFIAIAWLIRERPRLTPTQRIPPVWAALTFALFSIATKGVARYLTPVWPALAMVGGHWLAGALRSAPRDDSQARARRAAVTAAFIAAALLQGGYYAFARQPLEGQRSARELMRELIDDRRVDPQRLATYGFPHDRSEILDFYAARPVPPWSPQLPHAQSAWVLVREHRLEALQTELADAALAAEPVLMRERWRQKDTRVLVVRIHPR